MSNWRKASYSSGNGACVELGSWRKASYSMGHDAGNCVELGSWRKASFSLPGGECVEAGHTDNVIGVRDTTDRDGVTLEFPAAAWEAFTRKLKA